MIQGGLFTRDFLLEGVLAEPAWRALADAEVQAARSRLTALLTPFARQRAPNEAETEAQLIFPVLDQVLSWPDWLPQQNLSAAGRQDVPDALLFADKGALERAQTEQPWRRFQHGLCLVESKRWNRPLDRPADPRDKRHGEEGVPSAQIIRYLRRADDLTAGKLRWGMLTNGRLWRLYWQGAVSVAEDFLEIDLGKALRLPGCELDLLDQRQFDPDHALRLFLLLFGRAAFLSSEGGRTFHAVALAEGKRWEEKVAHDLSKIVFEKVFPVLAAALARHDRARPTGPDVAWLEQVRQGALILLYRLLFVLYAEDRDLLPDDQGPYAAYSLTLIRREIAQARGSGRTPSPRAAIYWARLKGAFAAIAQGDDDLGVPPYNGGLFEPEAAPLLERVDLPDSIIAEIIFALSHVDSERGPKYVNYRDLSVQQLGSVYERILEFGLRLDEVGEVVVDRDDDERHDSGSYYTPEALVTLIIERAVGPLVKERGDAFENAVERLAGDRRPIPERLGELAVLDPASALLELKVCDPAMGSGHFLVSLVDWLADRVLAALAEASAQVAWGEYASPLLARVATVRERIMARAREHGWPVTPEQLDDRHVVRRMILKRVVYGVDKNPMAVELAKVSLWLHTFTVGAPLSFLNHHLRCGDSIVGAWVRPTLDAVAQGGGLLSGGEIARVEGIAAQMTEIEESTDNDVAEVKASETAFGVVADATRELDAFFSLMAARPALSIDLSPGLRAPKATPRQLRDAKADGKKIATAEMQQATYDRAAAFKAVLGRQYGDPLKIASGEIVIAIPDDDHDQPLLGEMSEGVERRRRAATLVSQARALTARERFLHWPVAFPNVWRRLTQPIPDGGFDAVIGNPPYVRQERLAALKPALAAGYATYAGMADLYVYFFEQGLKLAKPGGRVGYVVTNKWLKAGYAEELRALLVDPTRAETEVVIDFGHARAFFPDADVFPNVVVVRRPDGAPASDELIVSVPSRDTLPDDRLVAAVEAASFPLARAAFTRESWTLEPKPVMDLVAKIRRAGVPLVEYAGVKPYRGVLTGFNDAFLIDTAARDRLVAADPASAELVKPYLRGQDIQRWSTDWAGLWMIFTRRGVEIERYPAILAHLERFRVGLEPKPENWTPRKPKDEWPGRKAGTYSWYEIQDSIDYWREFHKPKIIYQEIQFHSRFALDRSGLFANAKTFFVPSGDAKLLAVLNSPLMWWHNWRYLPHMKDEALTPVGFLLEKLPVALPAEEAGAIAEQLVAISNRVRSSTTAIHDWLRFEFGIDRSGRALERPESLDADGFTAGVRAALPRGRQLSAAEIARLKREHAATIAPAREAAAESLRLERRLSDLVNAAYGLTPEDVALMWSTAPPRMPHIQL